MAESPITPPSPRTGMAGSARAICCGASLRQSCGAASEKVWLVAKPLPSANRQKGIEGEKALPPQAAGRAVQEYLAVLDDAAFGAATEVTPKFISPADPAARWTGAHGGHGFFACL